MPTGQKSIAWTQENVSKLFGSILVVHADVKINYDAVAEAFGTFLAFPGFFESKFLQDPVSTVQPSLATLPNSAPKRGSMVRSWALLQSVVCLLHVGVKQEVGRKLPKL